MCDRLNKQPQWKTSGLYAKPRQRECVFPDNEIVHVADSYFLAKESFVGFSYNTKYIQ